jgi:DNA polymerase-3 subunit delta'
MAIDVRKLSGDYPWLQSAGEQWQSWLQNDALPHALMLLGSWQGDAVALWVQTALQQLFCTENNACGVCESCRWMAEDHHPDLFRILPAEKSRIIPIDDVRAAIDSTRLSAHQGGWRVILVQDADRMNMAAANALLKTLEEPGEGVLVCLQTSRPSLLPETVRSRCLVLDLRADQIAAENWLRQRNPAASKREIQLILAAAGTPLAAAEWMEGEALDEIHSLVAAVEDMLSHRRDVTFPSMKMLTSSAILAVMGWVVRSRSESGDAAELQKLIVEWWSTTRSLADMPQQLQMATVKSLWVRWIALSRKISHS